MSNEKVGYVSSDYVSVENKLSQGETIEEIQQRQQKEEEKREQERKEKEKKEGNSSVQKPQVTKQFQQGQAISYCWQHLLNVKRIRKFMKEKQQLEQLS